MELKALKRIDLNLLVALQILLEESNVSRAAERLFITQPAMSKTLGRLRDVFDDPLFIRGPHGIRPTPRALELQKMLCPILEDIDALVAPVIFDPANYQGEITIVVSEYIGLGIMPVLMKALQQEAPGIRIKTLSRVEHQLDHLADGDLDLALHMRRSNYGAEFNAIGIAGGSPVFLCRDNHPLANNIEITLDDLDKFSFVSFYISDREELALFEQEASPNAEVSDHFTRFETAHLLTAIEVVRNTDLLMVAPPILANNPLINQGITQIPTPTNSLIDYMLVTHKRTDRSAPVQWVKQKIIDICNTQHPYFEDTNHGQ